MNTAKQVLDTNRYSFDATDSQTLQKSSTLLKDLPEPYMGSMRAKSQRPRFLGQVWNILTRLMSAFGQLPIDCVKRDMLEDFLKSQPHGSNIPFLKKRIVEFFGWCKANGYLPPDLPTAADMVSLADIAQSRRVFPSCAETQPHLVITLKGGIRARQVGGLRLR
jgi:hypothetical protein